jgi:hypothetical protein
MNTPMSEKPLFSLLAQRERRARRIASRRCVPHPCPLSLTGEGNVTWMVGSAVESEENVSYPSPARERGQG